MASEISAAGTGKGEDLRCYDAGPDHVAGQIGDDLEAQPWQALAKIKRSIARAGVIRAHLRPVNVFLPDIADFDAMNAVDGSWIAPDHPSARLCIQSRLANPNLRVKITSIAVTRS